MRRYTTILEEYKAAHEKLASSIPGWKKMNKNDLINKYIEVENDPKLADVYMSAIICRYWWVIGKYFNTSKNAVKDYTIFYDWLVRGVMKAIKNRKWKDPENKLYTDKNGPDKVVNRCLISQRLEWFQHSNKKVRRLNYNLESLDKLQEDLGDSTPLPVYEDIANMSPKFISGIYAHIMPLTALASCDTKK